MAASAGTTRSEARSQVGAPALRWAPLAAWAAGVLLVFGPGLFSGFRRILGGLGDVRLIHFTLEHGYRWLAGYALNRDFWSPPIFHPQAGVSAYTDVLLGVGPFYWLFRWLGVPPDIAFHLWIVTIWTLNFAAAVWLLRRSFGLGPIGAAAGGFIFAFGAWRQANVIHQQLAPSFYLLISVVALAELFGDRRQLDPAPSGAQRRRAALWIGAFFGGLAAQAWTAFYPLYFFLMALAAALAWALLLPRPRRRLGARLRRHLTIWAVAGLLAAAAVAPLAVRYRGAAREVGLRDYPQSKVPRPVSWVLMGQTNLIYGGLQGKKGPFWELRETTHSNGSGPVTTVLALIGLWGLRRRPGVALTALAAATLIAVSTTLPGGVSGWHWVHAYLPGAAAIRAVGRIGIVTLVPLAIGLGAFFSRLAQRRRWLAAALLAAVCLAEQLHAIAWRDRDELRAHIAGIASQISPRCESFLLVSRGYRRYPYTDEDAAWVALLTGIPTINGRYGNRPPGWGLHETYVKGPKRRLRLRRKLDSWIERQQLDPRRVCWVELRTFPERVGLERHQRPPRRRTDTDPP